MSFDRFDRALLVLIQQDNTRTLDQLGEEVGLSPSAVRQRIAKLKKEGVIQREVALLDPDRLGVTVIVSVRFEKESLRTYEAFKKEIGTTEEISQCYTVSGEDDFLLIGHFKSMADYDEWVKARLLTNPAIARSTTRVVYRRVKYSTSIPV